MRLIGIGLYTFQEASRLVDIPARDLRRWLKGYSYKLHGTDERTFSAPIWQAELTDPDMEGISFHDLLEVRFVHAFRKVGVSLQAIRCASEHARELFCLRYPFTSQRFRTDGRTIFAEALKETGETQLLDLVTRQYAFAKIIQPSLYSGIEFGADELAFRWYPMARSTAIMLDPLRSFGKPIVTEGYIKTSILYDAFKAEKSKHLVAQVYEVPISAVEAAIRFEERLAA